MEIDTKQTIAHSVQKGSVRFDILLSTLTTIRIGGPAAALVQTDNREDLQRVFTVCQEKQLPWYVLGGGSNVVFTDKGYRGVIFKLPLGTMITEKRGAGVDVSFGAGYLSSLAAQKTVEASLTGFESMCGLPGTIGGAILMNSKWPQGHFMTGDAFVKGEYVQQDGSAGQVSKDDMHFSYGYCALQAMRGILLNATFLLSPGNIKEGQERCAQVMAYRKQTQPTGVKTAGCIFKNISEQEQQAHDLPTTSAGYLVDRVGLKGTRHGGLTVSPIHANFFVNDGTATFADYTYLVEKAREKVYDQYSLMLKEEVVVINEHA